MTGDGMPWLVALVDMLRGGMIEPWAIALALALLTLLFEDAAIAAAILLAGDGAIGWPLAFAAVAGGIAGGDMLLYLAGVAARRIPLVRRRIIDPGASQRIGRLLAGNPVRAVLIARVVPGLRLAVYTAFGLLSLPFLPFALVVSAAVITWTAFLFWLGSTAAAALTQAWGLPAWHAAAALLALLVLVPLLARRVAAAHRRWRS